MRQITNSALHLFHPKIWNGIPSLIKGVKIQISDTYHIHSHVHVTFTLIFNWSPEPYECCGDLQASGIHNLLGPEVGLQHWHHQEEGSAEVELPAPAHEVQPLWPHYVCCCAIMYYFNRIGYFYKILENQKFWEFVHRSRNQSMSDLKRKIWSNVWWIFPRWIFRMLL